MEENIKKFIDDNTNIKHFYEYPKEELQVIRMYINLELARIYKKEENPSKISIIKTCLNEAYNYFDYILSTRYKIDTGIVSVEDKLDKVKKFGLCEFCDCKVCIKRSVAILLDEINTYNEKNNSFSNLFFSNINRMYK